MAEDRILRDSLQERGKGHGVTIIREKGQSEKKEPPVYSGSQSGGRGN